MKHPVDEVAFLKAVLADDQPGITAYFDQKHQSIVPQLMLKVARMRPDQYDTAFIDAFLKICDKYIHSEKCRLVNGRIEGLTSGGFGGLLLTTAYRELLSVKKKGNYGEGSAKVIDFEKELYQKIDKALSESGSNPAKQEQRVEALHKALTKLRPECRDIINLYEFVKYSLKEIAERRGSSPETVKTQKSRCMRQLGKFFFASLEPQDK